MDLCVTIKGVSFLLQTGLGILGNLLVLLAYAHIVYCKRRLQPVDMILFHLAFANMMVLLTRGAPQTITDFQLHNLLDDVGCKIVIYSYRIVRALSICITCLLSVFQSLTIAPATSRWANLKTRLPKLILPSFGFLWLLNMAVCIAAPFFSVAPRNGTDQLSYVINGVAITGRDFIFVGLMVLASGYILLVLHRHSKQMKGFRSSDRHQSSTLESRAAKTVITLVILYVVFFGIDNIIWIYMLTVSSVPPVISDMRVFFSSCYASLSPFFIISSNKKIKRRISCASEEPKQQSPASEVSHVKL
ncbi:Vomeronasal type-1 receptor 1 [Acipenser ruthenus]|uniref:Vomeronasal type-1 receptor n=1 Tax=Acipenser ruthenus TaxID=7906 RepID=A0A444UWH8_ACIRT|nr:Vomeronasal type-1 receptor 1 [Acipenser ruthenus]